MPAVLVWVTGAAAMALAAAPALADDVQVIGDAEAALPGIGRVGAATPLREGAALSAFAGYGFTGGVLGLDDSHHRAAGQLGATLRLVDWIGFGLRLDGRYDRHALESADGSLTDDGWVGDPRIVVRAARPLGAGLHLGGQINLWFPGGDAPDLALEATSVEAAAIASLVPPGATYSLSLNLGYRVDNSAETVADPDALSLSDRMALGASDFDAVLVGLGATYRAGAIELLGEVTWDLLIGDLAPERSRSPLETAAGLRVHLARALQLQVLGRTRLSSDPEIAPGKPLVPVHPRLALMAGLHVQLGGRDRAADGPLVTRDEAPERPVAAASIRGRVLSGGAPIAGARVTLIAGARRAETATDAGGRFRFDAIPGDAAEGKLRVELEGFEPLDAGFALSAGETATRDLELERILPPGQIRGVVRDFRGQPVIADITILPLDKKIKPGPDGAFQIAVPPGDYEVVVERRGYATQRLEARVDERQVTILNIDLERP